MIVSNCYITGPMRNCRAYNYQSFFELADLLRGKGVWVFNPATVSLDVDPEWEDKTGTEKISTEDLIQYFRHDFSGILDVAGKTQPYIICLPNHEYSFGSFAEKMVAKTVCVKSITAYEALISLGYTENETFGWIKRWFERTKHLKSMVDKQKFSEWR